MAHFFFFSGQAKHLAENFAQLASSRLVLDLGLFFLFSVLFTDVELVLQVF